MQGDKNYGDPIVVVVVVVVVKEGVEEYKVKNKKK